MKLLNYKKIFYSLTQRENTFKKFKQIFLRAVNYILLNQKTSEKKVCYLKQESVVVGPI